MAISRAELDEWVEAAVLGRLINGVEFLDVVAMMDEFYREEEYEPSMEDYHEVHDAANKELDTLIQRYRDRNN